MQSFIKLKVNDNFATCMLSYFIITFLMVITSAFTISIDRSNSKNLRWRRQEPQANLIHQLNLNLRIPILQTSSSSPSIRHILNPIFAITNAAEEVQYNDEKQMDSDMMHTSDSRWILEYKRKRKVKNLNVDPDEFHNSNRVTRGNENDDYDASMLENDIISSPSNGFLQEMSSFQQERRHDSLQEQPSTDKSYLFFVPSSHNTDLSSHKDRIITRASSTTAVTSDDDQVIYRRTNRYMDENILLKPSTLPNEKLVRIHNDGKKHIKNDLIANLATTSKDNDLLLKSQSKKISTVSINIDSPPTSKVITISSSEEYQKFILEEREKLVVVRFYASWCRACQAIQVRYRQQLPILYPNVKFVEVRISSETASFVQKQIPGAVPSIPYAHIYHPQIGLVEEQKISRTYFSNFVKLLQTYNQGYCDIIQDDKDSS